MGRFIPSRKVVPGSTKAGTDTTDTHQFTGSINVSGNVYAKEYHVQVVSSSIIYASGSHKFGDSSDDFQMFTGSVTVDGALSASQGITASFFLGSGQNLTGLPSAAVSTYSNPSDNRVITSVNATTISAEAGLLFDGTRLAVTGNVLPGSNNAYTLGDSSTKWSHVHAMNIHTGDLHLKNHKGDWTLIEDTEYLTLKNNKTGKTYKLLMEEIG
tara:strand:- start:41203 stop:41841 length:639 start_codon:yes stop_codon:yes gene_type:complete